MGKVFRGGIIGWLRSSLTVAGLMASVSITAAQIDLDVTDIIAEQFAMRDIKLHIAPQTQLARLDIGQIQIDEWVFQAVRLYCPDFIQDAGVFACRKGMVRLGPNLPEWPVIFNYDGKTIALTVDPGENSRWLLTWSAGQGLSLKVNDADFGKLAQRIPFPEGTQLSGRVSAEMNWKDNQITGLLNIKDGSFNDVSGTHAGEKLSFMIRFSAKPRTAEEGTQSRAQRNLRRVSEKSPTVTASPDRTADPAVPPSRNRLPDPARVTWNWQAVFDWQGGEIFWQPFYFPHAQFKLDINGRLSSGGENRRDRLQVDRAELDIADVGKIAFDGVLTQGEQGIELRRTVLSSDRLDLKRAGEIFLAPWLAQNAHPALNLSGVAGVQLDFTRGKLNSLSVDLREASFNEARGRFGLEKITGRFTLKPEEEVAHNIRIGGARLGRFEFGAFDLAFTLFPDHLEVPQVVIPLLDGELHVKDLLVDKKSGSWGWEAAFSLYPVSLPLLTEALEMPRMEGKFSASIPKVKQTGVEISFDGGVVIQAFDGYIAAQQFKIIDLLGHLPRITTDLDIRHLDLGQLTQTFSFGRIEGFIDASVKDLEIARWKPVRFSGKIMSSEGNYRKRISQRAVENITALGGPGAAAAVQRGVLQLFNEFGYRRLGFSCILVDGVCQMGGVSDTPADSYTIVEGGGIPALSVNGYNRRVNWDELIERLQRIIETNTAPVIE